ncbi:RNA-protein complex protein Nop10 [Candidatus Woesearchaeota archaeon]|nr:RNA-protein complex protein Nop10 [Candidatus Woesearchaeota archaeon]
MPLKFCRPCSRYTLKENCPGCGGATTNPKPPKFAPEDKYADYRRKMKDGERKAGGMV